MERFINILVVENNEINKQGIKEILSGGGNNVIYASSKTEALAIIQQKEIGILLVNIDDDIIEGKLLIEQVAQSDNIRELYKIAITSNPSAGAKMVKGLNEGVIDFITIPFNPNLVRAKIDVFKSMYYKDNRIHQLLSNIFPEKVLEELSQHQKFSPKRVENGVIMFTDFVDFSLKSKSLKPLKILHILENYFTKFDEIMSRYQLEKIKTIGDSYMALAGVTENYPEPEIRACLAALEIKQFLTTEMEIAKALGKSFWEIRIGLHAGPLVAGIIGTKKFSFDVWGDSVNIAKRAEESSKAGEVTITESIYQKIKPYLSARTIGEIPIHKRGGKLKMHQLEHLLPEWCLKDDAQRPSASLRQICGLATIDFENMRTDILNRLRSLLPDELSYHDLNHTINVEKAAIRIAKLEGVGEEDLLLLRTAALYHDSGYLLKYENNEEFAVKYITKNLPNYGYSPIQIERIKSMIDVTTFNHEPKSILEKIICDADLDYLGRPDYYVIANKLRTEMENFHPPMTETEWIEFQLHFLTKKHNYYTDSAKNIRLQGKLHKVGELKQKLKELKELKEN
ncbi:MAG: adenylate/guanylate cyclase domain-containing protein [Bacteroidota bacterium]